MTNKHLNEQNTYFLIICSLALERCTCKSTLMVRSPDKNKKAYVEATNNKS